MCKQRLLLKGLRMFKDMRTRFKDYMNVFALGQSCPTNPCTWLFLEIEFAQIVLQR